VAAEPAADRLGLLFEGAPRFTERLRSLAPQATEAELIDRAETLARDLPEQELVELLNAHPRIGTRPGSVSALSYREQGYDRDPGTAELQSRLDRLNAEYERRFGFRFVVFVAGRPRSEIAALMERQLEAGREHELRRAIGDVIAIARDRLRRLEQEESG
jgi:2-oxo-4-hydroxy-4-carboxy--5-ureidoimidazoline (OHCU) decarboxylase